MCRMLIYKGSSSQESILLSDLVVRPTHSIIQQSYSCRERFADTGLPSQINADGFGVGWYVPSTEGAAPCGCILKDDPKSVSVEGWNKSYENGGTSPPMFSGHSSSHQSTRSRGNSAVNAFHCTCATNGRNRSACNDRAHREKLQYLQTSPQASTSPSDDSDADSKTPGVFVSISPAWNNVNLINLSKKISSPLIFAHVRAASIGSVTTETNCHPFVCGRYMWMHNGGVADFGSIKRRLLAALTDTSFEAVRGTTDSELCFALFLSHLEKGQFEKKSQIEKKGHKRSSLQIEKGEGAGAGEGAGGGGGGGASASPPVVGFNSLTTAVSPSALQRAMESTIGSINRWTEEAGVEDASLLNFAVSDGQTVIVTRYSSVPGGKAASLYLSSGTKWRESVDHPGDFIMQQTDRRQSVVIVASERLSADAADWCEIPRNHLVVVEPSMNVLFYPLDKVVRPQGGGEGQNKNTGDEEEDGGAAGNKRQRTV